MLQQASFILSRKPFGYGSSAVNFFKNVNVIRPSYFVRTLASYHGKAATIRKEVKVYVPSIGKLADPFVPPTKETIPSLFSKEGFSSRWEVIKKKIVATYSIARIKKHIKTFKPVPFAREAQDLYIHMNECFAKGDRQELKTIVSEQMYNQLKLDIKSRQANYVWTFDGELSRPRIVHCVALQAGDNILLAQATVLMHTSQSISIKHSNNLKTASQNVLEYVVLERILGVPNSSWRICGKIDPSK